MSRAVKMCVDVGDSPVRRVKPKKEEHPLRQYSILVEQAQGEKR
jgi:hypothetical protein